MSVTGARSMAGGSPKEPRSDAALGSIGISAALVSASFAGYMVVVGPGSDGRHAAAPTTAAFPPPPHVFAGSDALPAAGALLAEGIDFTPTGSIPELPETIRRREPASDPTAVLNDFAVRDVFDGTALVEAHGALQMVKVGATVAGAGRVLGMAQADGLWTVRTSGGVIKQRR